MGLISTVQKGLAHDFKALGQVITTRRRGDNPVTGDYYGPLIDFGWRATHSAVHITEETALEIPTVYSAVNLITSAIAGLPIDVYQQIEGIRVPMDTPLTQLLSVAPNPEMPAMTFWEQLVSHEVLYGNAYIFIVKNTTGDALQLWPLHPKSVTVGRYNGVKYYSWDGNSKPAMIDFSAGGEIIHIANFGTDSLKGESPVKLMRESIGLTKASEEYSARFFSANATPTGLISTDKDLTVEQSDALKAKWDVDHRGLVNSGGVGVLSNGAKFQQVSVNPEDSQLLDQRRFQVAEIARIFRVPPHLIADVERSTSWGTGIEEQARNFVEFSLNPHILRFEHAINVHLLNKVRSGRYMKFNVNGLLRADAFQRFQTHAIAIQNRIETPNEVRRIEDLPPLPGGDGEDSAITAAGANEDVQALALNGAQISSLLVVVQQVTAGQLSPETADEMLRISFPSLSPEQIERLINSAASFNASSLSSTSSMGF